jgi:thiol-disulfide isomerase/thioredoxin
MWSKLKRYAELIGVIALAGLPSAGAALAEGEPFPAWADFELEGEVPAHAGQVVLVDFWASWCAPCKASFPVFDELQREWAEAGLVIIAVSVDKSAAAYEKFIERLKPGFVTVRDERQELVAAVKAPAMPTSYLMDRRGVVRFVHRGFYGDRTAAELRVQIKQLTEETL